MGLAEFELGSGGGGVHHTCSDCKVLSGNCRNVPRSCTPKGNHDYWFLDTRQAVVFWQGMERQEKAECGMEEKSGGAGPKAGATGGRGSGRRIRIPPPIFAPTFLGEVRGAASLIGVFTPAGF